MILEEITVKNWRSYREPHTFRFEDGINMLIGRNEAGKSTLFEAMTRSLFDRHNSKTEEIRAIRPIASSLGPEVTILFQSNGKRYKAVKRFLEDPKSELYSEREGRWELDHEGDQSDTRLREILRGEATTRTVAKPEHRGLAQALWYLQSDGSIPEDAWSEGVRQGLQGLVQVAVRSPREKSILEHLERAYDEYWTATGRVSSKGELGLLEKEIPELEESISELRHKASIIEGYRRDLEEFRNQESQKTTELQIAQKELDESSEFLQVAEELQREKETAERTQAETTEKQRRLRRDISLIEERQQKIQEWRVEIHELEESVSETGMSIRQEAAASERHEKRRREDLEPGLRAIEADLRALHAAANIRKLEKDRDRLQKHVDNIVKTRNLLDGRRKELAKLIAPDGNDLEGYRKKSEKLTVLAAKIEAGAVRVTFQWDGKAKKVTTEPQVEVAEDDTFIVAEPTEFKIQGVGKMHIRSGAQALRDLLAKKQEIQQDVDNILARYAVKTTEDLVGLHETRLQLERDVAGIEESLEEIAEEEPDAEDELARVNRGIEEEERARGVSILGASDRGGRWIREQMSLKEKQKNALMEEIEKEQDSEKRASQLQIELVKKRETIRSTLAERKAQVSTSEENIAEILQTYGTIDHLRNLVESAEEEMEKAESALEAILEDYEEKVDTPRRLHQQTKERANELQEQAQDLRMKLAETLARIEESVNQSNYSQLADLEIELERKTRREKVLRSRADGAKVLHDLVALYERQRLAALSGPIQDIVNKWLRLLTEGAYDLLRIDDALKPTGVKMARYEEDLPLTSLSHGAQEQVVVLLRLAIGVLVSREEKNLVVIDDRLVNTDAVRMKRLCLILQDAAKACHLVIATCNDTPYAGIGAHIVRVPSDGVVTGTGI